MKKIDLVQTTPPEMLDDTPTQYILPVNSQIILKCKFRSIQKPTTIKWFKRKDYSYKEPYQSFVESYRTIKYFENFYEPLVSLGIQELNENVYLSKLNVNNITENSVYVCVAINYFGFSFRESFINVKSLTEYDYEFQEKSSNYPEKNYEILFLIPILLMPTMLICTTFYLLIHRQMLKKNKSPETISL